MTFDNLERPDSTIPAETFVGMERILPEDFNTQSIFNDFDDDVTGIISRTAVGDNDDVTGIMSNKAIVSSSSKEGRKKRREKSTSSSASPKEKEATTKGTKHKATTKLPKVRPDKSVIKIVQGSQRLPNDDDNDDEGCDDDDGDDEPLTGQSLIERLFANDNQGQKATTAAADKGHSASAEDSALLQFALFVEERADQTGKGSSEGRVGGQSRASSNESRDDSCKEEKAKSNPFLDPDVGHFCMPELEGFCEANFCIFHSSAAKKFNKQVQGSTINVRQNAE